MVDDGRTTDGRTEHGARSTDGRSISSPCEPDGSGELKMEVKYMDMNILATRTLTSLSNKINEQTKSEVGSSQHNDV